MKTPNTVILGVPRYDPVVELIDWIGKEIIRTKPPLFTDDTACPFSVGSKVTLVSVDDENMVVRGENCTSYLNSHYWADGNWDLVL